MESRLSKKISRQQFWQLVWTQSTLSSCLKMPRYFVNRTTDTWGIYFEMYTRRWTSTVHSAAWGSFLLKMTCTPSICQTRFFFGLQILEESMLEDINCLLGSGEVPNILNPDEEADIVVRVRDAVRATGKPDTKVSGSNIGTSPYIPPPNKPSWRRYLNISFCPKAGGKHVLAWMKAV